MFFLQRHCLSWQSNGELTYSDLNSSGNSRIPRECYGVVQGECRTIGILSCPVLRLFWTTCSFPAAMLMKCVNHERNGLHQWRIGIVWNVDFFWHFFCFLSLLIMIQLGWWLQNCCPRDCCQRFVLGWVRRLDLVVVVVIVMSVWCDSTSERHCVLSTNNVYSILYGMKAVSAVDRIGLENDAFELSKSCNISAIQVCSVSCSLSVFDVGVGCYECGRSQSLMEWYYGFYPGAFAFESLWEWNG